MTYQKFFSVVKILFFAFTVICFLASCQDEEIIETSATEQTTVTSSEEPTESNVASLTIEGENTEFAETVECTTCTYVVDANSEIINGQELGLKPGSVICLNAALKYGNLSFINLNGTPQKPIIIARTTFVQK